MKKTGNSGTRGIAEYVGRGTPELGVNRGTFDKGRENNRTSFVGGDIYVDESDVVYKSKLRFDSVVRL